MAGEIRTVRDELHLEYPFAGSRILRDPLRREGVIIGRERVIGLMRRLGIAAIYRRPNSSTSSLGHKIYPYLLRDIVVDGYNLHMDVQSRRISMEARVSRLIYFDSAGIRKIRLTATLPWRRRFPSCRRRSA